MAYTSPSLAKVADWLLLGVSDRTLKRLEIGSDRHNICVRNDTVRIEIVIKAGKKEKEREVVTGRFQSNDSTSWQHHT